MNPPSLTLVVFGSSLVDYKGLFKGLNVCGRMIDVELLAWDKVVAVDYGSNGGGLLLQFGGRAIRPDFILLRAGCKGDWSTQHVQVLRSLVHAAVPSLNTAHSFLMAQDKSALWGCLRQLQLRVGSKKFPLIPQIFYPTYRSMFFLPDLPVVVKVGTASSGLGKMVLRTEEAWSDFRSISAMMDEFVTCEPFIDYDIDYRIQKIGPHHRVFARRVPDGSSWKANTASNMVDSEEVVTDEFRSWVDMAADACGMTICALDVIRRKSDGAYFILEINPSSIGLNPKVSDKDLLHIRDVTLAAMEVHFTQKQQQQQQLLEQTEESLEVSTDKYDHL